MKEYVNENPDLEEDDGPIESYANNVNFQGTIWDLTMYFGDYGLRPYGTPEQKGTTIWHTAVTMPWIQAKIACFFLCLNVQLQELENGRISIPPRAIPPLPPDSETNPSAELVRRLHAAFFGDQK